MIKYVAITDLETTGLDPKTAEIIEIGSLRVDWKTLAIVDEYQTKVRPVRACEPGAAAVNGYTEAGWADAPCSHMIWEPFRKFLGGKETAILAQNVTFDRGFLREYEQMLGPLGVDYHYLDLCSMALAAKPELTSLSLVSLAPTFGITPEPLPHRAINGAWTAYQILRKIRGRDAE